MSSPSAPLNHCPPPLVPIMLEILAVQNASTPPKTGQGIHEKTIELCGHEFDQLMVLFYNAFGSPFSCTDTAKEVDHTLSFVEKPVVLQQTVTSEARHYTVHVKLMKLPTVPGSVGPA